MRRGAVAVIIERDKFLVIRRAASVSAPLKLCFPGGGIEAGETEEAAVERELWEELRTRVRPIRRVWENITPWNVHLVWWLSVRIDETPLEPQPAEVAEVLWVEHDELARHVDLLLGNRDFLHAVMRGEISLLG